MIYYTRNQRFGHLRNIPYNLLSFVSSYDLLGMIVLDKEEFFHMSQKRDKGNSQKGKPSADTVKPMIAAEDLETAIHPTKRQNAES